MQHAIGCPNFFGGKDKNISPKVGGIEDIIFVDKNFFVRLQSFGNVLFL